MIIFCTTWVYFLYNIEIFFPPKYTKLYKNQTPKNNN